VGFAFAWAFAFALTWAPGKTINASRPNSVKAMGVINVSAGALGDIE
jgi:hypothetical protein